MSPQDQFHLLKKRKLFWKQSTQLFFSIAKISRKIRRWTLQRIWYVLLTEKRYYENCLNVNDFALRFLTRSLNECVVEVQVSTISSIESSSRTLKHETSERLTFVSSNGPHPLKAMKLIEDALNMHFKGKPWHFVLSDSKYYVSRVVERLMKEADALPKELAW